MLAAVETKLRGYATDKPAPFPDDDDSFGTATKTLLDNELSYALGKKGGTRKKLAASSECIVECARRRLRRVGHAPRARAPPAASRTASLASASACLRYVGNTVYMCGSPEQRAKAAQYLDWLFAQLRGPVSVEYASRDDCTVVEVRGRTERGARRLARAQRLPVASRVPARRSPPPARSARLLTPRCRATLWAT